MRSERIPWLEATLLAALRRKQHSTPTLIPPAAQARSLLRSSHPPPVFPFSQGRGVGATRRNSVHFFFTD